MAHVRQIGKRWYVSWRWAEKPFQRSVGHSKDDAVSLCKRIEARLLDLRTGRATVPLGIDLGLWFLSDGKTEQKATATRQLALAGFIDAYKASLPPDAKDPATLKTEEIHHRHLIRVLGPSCHLPSLNATDLQLYIGKRAKEGVQPSTAKKEIVTLRIMWNSYGAQSKVLPLDFATHFGRLTWPKGKPQGAFATFDQIKRRIERECLEEEQQAALWECLFLSAQEIAEVLGLVKSNANLPVWVYPAFMMAAHTGARRSELFRSRVSDWDIEAGQVSIREKKRQKDKTFSFRIAALTPQLQELMKSWLSHRQNAQLAFSHSKVEGSVIPSQSHREEKAISPQAAQYWFNKALAGTKWAVLKGWHVFRHSFASVMASNGIDQRLIDATLGHTTEEMRQRYRHLFPSQQREAVKRVFG